jgi:hypothetical protein
MVARADAQQTALQAAAALHLGAGCLCMFFCWGALLDLQQKCSSQRSWTPACIVVLQTADGVAVWLTTSATSSSLLSLRT